MSLIDIKTYNTETEDWEAAGLRAEAVVTEAGSTLQQEIDALRGIAENHTWGNITGDITDQEDLVQYITAITGDIGKILDDINGVVV